MRGKGRTVGAVLTASAVAAAAAVACLAAFAFLPSGTEARYSGEDVYAGQEIGMDEDVLYEPCVHSHDDPDDDEWIDLNEFVGDATSFSLYRTSNSDKSKNGKYYLSDDLACRLTISASYGGATEIDLCLNGHVLRNPSDSGSCLNVTRGSRNYDVLVNLYDCGGDMERHCYKIVESGYDTRYYDFSDGGIDPDDPGTYDGFVRGGLITGGAGDGGVGSPGGVNIADNNGNNPNSQVDVTLNMYGGTIAGNHTGGMGAGVCVNSGKFNMYGGCIEGNAQTGIGSTDSSRSGGGGVVVEGASTTGTAGDAAFRMYGGTIRDNCSANWGGGVQVTGTSYSAVFEMYGGTIEGNRAQYGGGVGMYETSSSGEDLFRMYGGTIRDNTSEYEGAGVYMRADNSAMEMSGGTITGNVQEGYEVTGGTTTRPEYSDNCGGGIYFYNDDSITLSGTAYVYGNLCAGKRCNIGLKEGHCISLGEFEDGAKIGVTLIDGQEGITDALDTPDENLSSCLRYIVSDDTSYKVAVNGEGTQLVLQKKKES